MQQLPTNSAASLDQSSAVGGANVVFVLDNNMQPIGAQTIDSSSAALLQRCSSFVQPAVSPANIVRPVVQHSPSVFFASHNNPGPSGSKDSRWLTLEVCREFVRGKCSRSENECKFAHPPDHVEINNGKVIACFDNLKGRCQRINPPCKYLHPPQHLKEILLHNGRNNLLLRTIAMQSGLYQAPTAASATPLYRTPDRFLGGNTIFTTALPGQLAVAGTMTPSPLAAAGGTFLQAFPAQGGTTPIQLAYAAPSALSGLVPSLPAQSATLAGTGSPTTFFAVNPTLGTATPISLNLGSANPQQHMDLGASAAATNFPMTALVANTPALSPSAAGQPMGNAGSALFSPNLLAIRAAQSGQLLGSGSIRTDRLEVCAGHQKGVCPYSANACPYAHPPAHCPIDSEGLVTVCVDYVKGKCMREVCKYFHPPDHLIMQLKSGTASGYSLVSNLVSQSAFPTSGQTLLVGTINPNAIGSPVSVALPTSRYAMNASVMLPTNLATVPQLNQNYQNYPGNPLLPWQQSGTISSSSMPGTASFIQNAASAGGYILTPAFAAAVSSRADSGEAISSVPFNQKSNANDSTGVQDDNTGQISTSSDGTAGPVNKRYAPMDPAVNATGDESSTPSTKQDSHGAPLSPR